MDVLQLPLSHNGHQYAVVFVDYLTQCPEVFPVKRETIGRLLVEHVIARHGVPEPLLSERGLSFLSAFIHGVYKLVGTTKLNTSGYNPQYDEKYNSTLINVLVKSANKYGRDWDAHSPSLMVKYNWC